MRLTSFKTWQWVLGVAALVGLFAVLGLVGGVEFSILVVPVVALVMRAPHGKRQYALAWACALYPVSILLTPYILWLVAWCLVGHPPQPYVDDPKYIKGYPDGPWMVLVGSWLALPFAIVATVMLTAFPAEWRLDTPARERRGAAPLLIMPLVCFVVFAMLRWDPLRVLEWLMD